MLQNCKAIPIAVFCFCVFSVHLTLLELLLSLFCLSVRASVSLSNASIVKNKITVCKYVKTIR